MEDQARELLETVSRREAVLDCLADAPRDKRELTGRLDVSRQTVDRAIRELESAAMVGRTGEGYRLTPFGALAHREFESLLDRFEVLLSATDLLVHLPPGMDVDPDVLSGAEVVYADNPLPHEPIRALAGLLEDAGRIVGYSPIAYPQQVSLFHRQITRTETEVELVLDASLVEGLWSNYREGLREALSAPNFALHELPESHCPNVSLALFDDSTLWIGVYDDSGTVRGAIVSESDAAVAWARSHLERYRAEAETVSLPSTNGA